MPDAVIPAIIEHSFAVDNAQAVTPDDGNGLILRLLVGQINTGGTYMHAFAGRLTPDLAVAIGEHLVAEGRRLKTGLIAATADQMPKAA